MKDSVLKEDHPDIDPDALLFPEWLGLSVGWCQGVGTVLDH